MKKILCRTSDIPDNNTKGFRIDGLDLFVVKKSGDIRIYLNNCPHLGVPLEWLPDRFLDESGELIQCSTHGALFSIETGVCIAGPCIGDHLQPVPFTIIDGVIEIDH